MGIFAPLIASILQAGSFTLDKFILRPGRADYRTYIGLSFPIVFGLSILLYIFVGPAMPSHLFEGKMLAFLLLALVMSIVTNLLFYRALESDSLAELETLGLLRGLPIIIFSAFLFADERSLNVVIPATIASLAIIWSHWNHKHFELNPKTWPLFIWQMLSAPAGAAITKILLNEWHPVALEMVRTGGLAIFFILIYAKHLKPITEKTGVMIVITNLLTSVATILHLWSYQVSGIIFTMLIFSLQPLLTYFGAIAILKEKVSHKKTVAFIIVLCSIIASRLLA